MPGERDQSIIQSGVLFDAVIRKEISGKPDLSAGGFAPGSWHDARSAAALPKGIPVISTSLPEVDYPNTQKSGRPRFFRLNPFFGGKFIDLHEQIPITRELIASDGIISWKKPPHESWLPALAGRKFEVRDIRKQVIDNDDLPGTGYLPSLLGRWYDFSDKWWKFANMHAGLLFPGTKHPFRKASMVQEANGLPHLFKDSIFRP